VSVPCAGEDPFNVRAMLPLCGVCPEEERRRCLVSAANAPFPMIERQVWGGLILPRDAALLPAPSVQAAYPDTGRVHEVTERNKKGAGRPPWWVGIGRNFDPDLVA